MSTSTLTSNNLISFCVCVLLRVEETVITHFQLPLLMEDDYKIKYKVTCHFHVGTSSLPTLKVQLL